VRSVYPGLKPNRASQIVTSVWPSSCPERSSPAHTGPDCLHHSSSALTFINVRSGYQPLPSAQRPDMKGPAVFGAPVHGINSISFVFGCL
ncbi:hypothetical protein KUCAC02_011163, partial [Chaenocephalus aceratus]